MTTQLDLVQTFLTRTEQSILPNLPFSLRNQLEERLLPSRDPNDIECAQRILTLFELPCPLELKGSRENFFSELLNVTANKRLEALNSLSKICQKQGFEAFFRCVSTTRIQYYSKEILLGIIDVFTTIANANPDLSCLSNFPSYEGEGKSWLERLKEKPDLKNFSFGHLTSSSSKLLLPPVQQLDEVFKEATSFEKTKTLAIRYLTSLPDSSRFPMGTYLKIFHNIQNAPKFFHLPEISKICLLKLILSTTSKQNEETRQLFFSGDLDELLEEVLANHICWGEQFLIMFCNAPEMQKSPSLDDVIRTFRLSNLLAKDYRLCSQVQEYLQSFGSGLITLEEFITSLETLAPEALETLLNLPGEKEDLEALQSRMQNVSFPLPEEHLDTIQKQYAVIEYYCDQFKGLRLGQLVELASKIRAKGVETGFQEDDLLQLIGIGRLAAFIKFQLYARSTQIYTVLGQLCYEEGAMAQVKTGEGKSLIITLLGFILSMQNKSVHIISSDQSLSIRDQRKAASFFESFGISTSNICKHHPKGKCFQAQILYGMPSDFEFAIMRELLYFEPLFEQKPPPLGEKRFDCVIIDELDNLTIDTALSQARYSYHREETYEWVYLPIFTFVKENFNRDESDEVTLDNSIRNLRKFLEKYSHGLFKEQVHLFTNKQLETWLESAFKAIYQLEEDNHYVIKPNPEKEQDGNDKIIVVVDVENTGRFMRSSRWSDGLHEFVEVKHQMSPRRESLCPISLSHPVYYQMYRSLYGLTGTIGSFEDRDEIREIYETPSFEVPTFLPSRRMDYDPTIVPTQAEYLQKIQKTVVKCREKRRPVLVLCKTIRDSKTVASFLERAGIPNELLNEVQEKPEEEILDKAGYPGAVTVATNTAGRGTDIILKEDSEKNGGLHVLISHYPDSKRVEDQARGRAGRQGQNGSSEILISGESLENIPEHLSMQEKLDLLKGQRKLRTMRMKEIHLLQAGIERYVYQYVLQFYEYLGKFEGLLNNETFLDSASTALSKRKIYPKEIDLQGLKPKDRQIAEEALRLLMHPDQDVVQWKTLLKQIGKRIKDRTLNLWALDFYHKVHELLKRSNKDSDRLFKVKLSTVSLIFQGFTPALLSLLIKEEKERVLKLKQAISDLFDQKGQYWEKPLNASGAGILEYLREHTQTVLRGVEDAITK
ncbi:MAG: Protein translocase subunit SecA [Chlamydiae bacterium]|nr:Protein translocase subunit SecA [Chlamydiota bacterium]